MGGGDLDVWLRVRGGDQVRNDGRKKMILGPLRKTREGGAWWADIALARVHISHLRPAQLLCC